MATFSMCRILHDNNRGARDCGSGMVSVFLDRRTRQVYTSSQYLLQDIKVSVSLIHSDINTKNKSSLDSYANS